jgi:TPR repeat protein
VVPSPAAELFLQRGDQLLSQGDIIPARQFFERAAEGGDARAVYRMAKSYDPVYLRRIGVRGVAGDPAKAKAWYEKAIIAGSSEAEMALLQLRASFP